MIQEPCESMERIATKDAWTQADDVLTKEREERDMIIERLALTQAQNKVKEQDKLYVEKLQGLGREEYSMREERRHLDEERRFLDVEKADFQATVRTWKAKCNCTSLDEDGKECLIAVWEAKFEALENENSDLVAAKKHWEGNYLLARKERIEEEDRRMYWKTEAEGAKEEVTKLTREKQWGWDAAEQWEGKYERAVGMLRANGMEFDSDSDDE